MILFSIPEHPVSELLTHGGTTLSSISAEFQKQGVPYRTALRVIGNALDVQNACCVNIMEVAEGFAVRFQHSPSDTEPIVQEMNHTDLAHIAERMARSRRGLWALFKTRPESLLRYESILRTLGRELDVVGASGLLVDEVDDGLVVTYHYKKPTEGHAFRKRLAFLDRDSLQDAASKDQDRRSTR